MRGDSFNSEVYRLLKDHWYPDSIAVHYRESYDDSVKLVSGVEVRHEGETFQVKILLGKKGDKALNLSQFIAILHGLGRQSLTILDPYGESIEAVHEDLFDAETNSILESIVFVSELDDLG